MAVTQRGNKWEIQKSLWILCSFVVLVNGMGMYFAGKKSKVKRWYNYGLIYTAIAWIGLIMGGRIDRLSTKYRLYYIFLRLYSLYCTFF